MTRTLVGTPDLDPQPAEPGLPTELLDLSTAIDNAQARLRELADLLVETMP